MITGKKRLLFESEIGIDGVQLITESGITAVGRLEKFKNLLMVENSILRLYRPGQPN